MRVLSNENQSSADELLMHLTSKFNRLLDTLKQEETEKRLLQRMVVDLQLKIQSYHDFDQVIATQDSLRENENLKQRVIYLEKEHSLTKYEKDKLQQTFEEMRQKIEERVPIIAEVEKRRLELEQEAIERSKEMKNIQD